MMPLLAMTGRKGHVWGRAWNCAPALEAIAVELRGISDDGADTVQVLAFSTLGQAFGPVLFAAQRTIAQHCGLLETPAPAASTPSDEGQKEQKAIVEACRAVAITEALAGHVMAARAAERRRELLAQLYSWRGKELVIPAGLWADVEQELNAKEAE